MTQSIEAARAKLASVLEAVEIASGEFEGQKLRRIAEWPIASLVAGETPCAIFALPETEEQPQRIAGGSGTGVRITEYVLRLGIFVQDESPEQAGKQLDAWRKAILDASDAQVQLAGTCDIARGPTVDPANAELFGGIQWPHVGFVWRIRTTENVTIAAGT